MELELLYVSEGSTPAPFPPGCPVSGAQGWWQQSCRFRCVWPVGSFSACSSRDSSPMTPCPREVWNLAELSWTRGSSWLGKPAWGPGRGRGSALDRVLEPSVNWAVASVSEVKLETVSFGWETDSGLWPWAKIRGFPQLSSPLPLCLPDSIMPVFQGPHWSLLGLVTVFQGQVMWHFTSFCWICMYVCIYLFIKLKTFVFWPCHVACGILVSWPGIEHVLSACRSAES